MTWAFKLSTVGSGVSVGVLVGAKVSVEVDMEVVVAVNARVGVKLSVLGRLAEVETGGGEADAATCPLCERLQAEVIRIKIMGRK